MEPQEEIPERSKFWASGIQTVKLSGKVLDRTTIIFSLCLASFSFVIFWPIISHIDFEEAFFTPLVPFLISVFGVFKFGPNDILRGLFVASFMVSTVGVYLLTRDLTRRQLTSILAAVIYLIPPIPLFVLTFFMRGVLQTELGSAKSFFTIVYGDGANFLALAMIPFASLFLLKYLKFGKKVDLVWSAILCSLILLANASQSLSLCFIALIIFITQLFFGNVRAKVQRFLIAAILPIGLVSFWYTPHFWYIGANFVATAFVANIKLLLPLPFIVFLITLFFSFVFFARREDRMAIFFCFLVFIVFLVCISVWFVSGKSFVPHPHRMLPDLNMFGAIVISLLISMFLDRIHVFSNISKKISWLPARVVATISFAIFSFSALTLVSYLLSPVAIVFFGGTNGLWNKIHLSVLAEREAALSLSGGNFNLVSTRGDDWQIWLGIAVSLIFVMILMWVIIIGAIREQEAG